MVIIKTIELFIILLLLEALIHLMVAGRFELEWNDVAFIVVAMFFSSSYWRACLQRMKDKYKRHL